VPVNKSVKFGLKAKHIFLLIFFTRKKNRYVSHIRFTFHSKSLQPKYTVKLTKKKGVRDPQINKKRILDFFRIF
jgi:hypothetical protein